MMKTCLAAVMFVAAFVVTAVGEERLKQSAIVTVESTEARDPKSGEAVHRLVRGDVLRERKVDGDKVEGFDVWSRRRVVVDRKDVYDVEDDVEPLTARIEKEPTPEHYLDRARFYFQLLSYDDALQDASAAIRLKSDYAPALFARSEIRHGWCFSGQLGDLEVVKKTMALAFEDVNRCLKIDDKQPRYWFQKAVCASPWVGDDKSVDYYTKTIELAPHFAMAYNNRAKLYIDVGRMDEAFRDLTKALELDPEYSDAFTNRGIVYHRRGNLKSAVADATSAIRTNPENTSGYNNRAHAYLALKRYDDAIADYKSLLPLQQRDAEHGLANALFLAGRFNEALPHSEVAVELDPNDPSSYSTRGDIRKNLQQFELAFDDYDRAVSLVRQEFESSKDPELEILDRIVQLDEKLEPAVRKNWRFHYISMFYTNRGDAYFQQWRRSQEAFDLQAAQEDLRRAVLAKPDNPAPYHTSALIYLTTGDEKAAREAIERGRPWFKEFSSLLNHHAWELVVARDPKLRHGAAAVRYAEEACKLTDWKNAYILDTLAAAHAEVGDFDKAVERQTQAMKIMKEDEGWDLNERLELYRNKQPYRP